MRKKRVNNEDTSEVDMTPMLDIVFIMLIFFIVTTSFIKEAGITINRPAKSPDTNPVDTQTVIIEITDLEDITFAGRMIDRESVQANVEIALSQNPEVAIVVKVAESADSGLLVSVVDQIKLAGIEKVTVSRLDG